MRSIDTVIHKAGWIIVDPWTVIRNGYIGVKNGRIVETAKGRADFENAQVSDHGPGALMPAPVNAHTHLELSGLHKKIGPAQGFLRWVQALMRARADISPDQLMASARQGISELIKTGCRVVGEISSLALTRGLFMDSALSGIWFQEFLGARFPDRLNGVDKKTPHKAASLAGHAPHTTAPELLTGLKKRTKKNALPFSIHVAESEAENRFIATGKGAWANFLTDLQFDFKEWPLRAYSPVAYLDSLGLLDKDTLAVHVLAADKKDFRRLAEKRVKVCVCPRSNRFIHDRLPAIDTLLRMGIKPCLGTDSLASNDSLNMFDEMEFVARHYQGTPPGEILAMATINGARALGMEEHSGALYPGRLAHWVYAPVSAGNTEELLGRIVHGDFNEIKSCRKNVPNHIAS